MLFFDFRMLRCYGEDQCKGENQLICKSGQTCLLECIGSNACTDAALLPNGATEIEMICQGDNACSGDAEMTCASNAPCSLTCDPGNCDLLEIAVNGASAFECVGFGCPPSAPAPYIAQTSGNYFPEIATLFGVLVKLRNTFGLTLG